MHYHPAVYVCFVLLAITLFTIYGLFELKDYIRELKKMAEISKKHVNILNEEIGAFREDDEFSKKHTKGLNNHIREIEDGNNERQELLDERQKIIDDLKSKIKDLTPDDVTEQTVKELAFDLKTHGFNLIRINPDHVFLRQ